MLQDLHHRNRFPVRLGLNSRGIIHAPYRAWDHEVELTEKIIGCAIDVHRALGPGLLESAYKRALAIELRHHQIQFEREKRIPLQYRGVRLGDYYVDLIVAKRVVVEVKSV